MALSLTQKKKNWKLLITSFSDDYWIYVWNDKVRNEAVRQRTKLEELNPIIKERRLRSLGHVLRMEDNRIDWLIDLRIPKQTMYWQADHSVKPQSENQEDQGRTGSILYAKTWRALAWPGKMLNNLRSTEKTGVEVWPNVSTTQDGLCLSLIIISN